MKNRFPKYLLAFAIAVNSPALPGNSFAQGALTPPGSPAPGMKTLTQVEPRAAITNISTGVTLSQSGSYYLTGNLTVSSGDAISISANNIALDLNGFTISSIANPPSGNAVNLIGTLTNITIANGFIHGAVTNNGATTYNGSGFANGIFAASSPYNVRLARLEIHGCTLRGIYLGTGTSTLVRACRVNNTGWDGIVADLVLDSSANVGGYNQTAAIQASLVSNCRGISYGGPGISAAHVSVNSYGASTNGFGIDTIVADNCWGNSLNSTALRGVVVNNCMASSYNGTGLYTSLGCNSIGTTAASGSYAFYVTYLATGCAGYGPLGIYSFNSLASCIGTAVAASHKYNMP